MSFVPLRNPIGFGALDFVELVITVLLVTFALLWRPYLVPAGSWLSRKTGWCLLLFAVLPVGLRLALLSHHPIPVPDLYDEFGHLLVADTLRHWRLANPAHPMHRFFETFFVLQQPTYSSIYPIGSGLLLAIGWTVFGTPWAGVLLGTAAFCSLCYWMLRGWVTPRWAFIGGVLAVLEFGPLNQWTNNYWGGALTAAAGCLVFGALPRLRDQQNVLRNSILLGLGVAIHVLTRPYETVFLVIAIALCFVPFTETPRVLLLKVAAIATLMALPALGLTLLQNKRVTGAWLTLPYALSEYQYGVPAPLTFQASLTPHVPLTREQELDFRMQSGFHPGRDTVSSYFARLFFRIRYYRFYFFAPLYLALLAFLVSIRSYRWAWVPVTCALLALGVNYFPAFQFHYVAAAVCLFVLMSVKGLERITQLRFGNEAARAILFLCLAQFTFWYALHIPDNEEFAKETRAFDLWDSINHRSIGNQSPERRLRVADDLARIPGKLLVFVQYWPNHPFQEEWVYNSADIDAQRLVWARDLGDDENRKLISYYGNRKAMRLEPDARPPRLLNYEPLKNEAAPASVQPVKEQPQKKNNAKKPLLELEQVK